MATEFDATVKINTAEIPDFKSFEVVEQVGLAEVSFSIQLDKLFSTTTSDTATILYSLGGGADYLLVNDKSIEQIGRSPDKTTLSGAGSLITRYAPDKTIIFINQTWLKSICPNYYFRDGIIYKQDPGIVPKKSQGVSAERLFIPELPGKNVKDVEFKCIVQSPISYRTIAQYIGVKTGYKVISTCRTLYVQKMFVIEAGETYFEALARLFNIFNPMIFIQSDIIHILDVGGDAQTMVSGNGAIGITVDSFSLLSYNEVSDNQVVDHLVILGPSTNWTYIYQTALSTMRIKRSVASLIGEESTRVWERDFSQDTSEYLEVLTPLLTEAGVDIAPSQVFEFADPNVEKNGKQVRTMKVVTDRTTGRSVTLNEIIETYNVGGTLVHKVELTNKYADYETPIGHTKMEWARLGKLQGGVIEINIDGYKTTLPLEYEFLLISAYDKTFGEFIGETGQTDVDIDQYNLVQYVLDNDTIEGESGEEDVQVKQKPQIVIRNSMIGITPSSWEANEDDPDLGWRQEFMLTRRERIRYDLISKYLLRKNSFIEEFIPVHSNDMQTEDIPIKRISSGQDQIQRKWEFFCLNGNPNSIVQWDSNGNVPQPTPGGPGTVVGQRACWHPKVTISCPDLIDDNIAKAIARRYFSKRTKDNITATIQLVVPIPGLKIGSIIYIPTCTKQVFDWDTKLWATVNLTGQAMWVTKVKTICNFEGNVGSSYRKGEIYMELELKKKF